MAGFYVGIGGQKCGTGWLTVALRRHPEVLSHTIKEMHVFDCMFLPRTRRYWVPTFEQRLAELEARLDSCTRSGGDARQARRLGRQVRDRRDHLAILRSRRRSVAVRRYQEYFASRVAEAGPAVRCFGEITPAYALLPPDGFRLLVAAHPGAHVVFLLRDPVDRFWSAVRMRSRHQPGLDPVRTFEDALATPYMVDRGAYEKTLAALERSVPASQRLVLFTEDLFGPCGEAELERLSRFLGIGPIDADRASPRNEGAPLPLPADLEQRATHLFLPTYEGVLERIGRLPDRWMERLEASERG
jgi:hypothetical protein